MPLFAPLKQGPANSPDAFGKPAHGHAGPAAFLEDEPALGCESTNTALHIERLRQEVILNCGGEGR